MPRKYHGRRVQKLQQRPAKALRVPHSDPNSMVSRLLGSEKFRGILVSPVLSDTTKNLLKKYGLEWRELPIEENQSQETQNSNDENDKDSEESNEL